MQDKPSVPHARPSSQRTRRMLNAYGGWRRRRREELDSSVSALAPYEPTLPPGGYFSAERRRPARPANIESDFIVPLLQALAAATLTTIAALYLSIFFDLFVWHLACFIGLVVGGLWFAFALFLGRELLWIVERVTNQDFDGDGYIGQPDPEPRTFEPLEVIHRSETGSIKAMFRLDVDVDDSRLEQFFMALGHGESLAEAIWIGDGNLFSKGEYGRLLNELQRAGLIEWKNPNAHSQGRQLTDHGKDSIEQWAAHTHTQAS